MVIARTNRLLLRPFQPGDADAMQCVFGDAEVMRYGDGVRTPQWVAEWVRRQIDDHDRAGMAMWAVVEQGGAAAIGYCGLGRSPERCAADEAEIGYRLARARWGRRLASEAARAVRDHAFGTLRVPRLIAIIDPANAASVRVAERVGLRDERDVMLPGYTHPDRVYGLRNPSCDDPTARSGPASALPSRARRSSG